MSQVLASGPPQPLPTGPSGPPGADQSLAWGLVGFSCHFWLWMKCHSMGQGIWVSEWLPKEVGVPCRCEELISRERTDQWEAGH